MRINIFLVIFLALVTSVARADEHERHEPIEEVAPRRPEPVEPEQAMFGTAFRGRRIRGRAYFLQGREWLAELNEFSGFYWEVEFLPEWPEKENWRIWWRLYKNLHPHPDEVGDDIIEVGLRFDL